MRLLYIFFILLCAIFAHPQGATLGKASLPKTQVIFVENGGQICDQNHKTRNDIVYAGQTGNISYYIRKSGISYQFSKVQSWRETDGSDPKQKCKIPDTTLIYRLDANWINTNPGVSWKGEGILSGYENFYNSNCPLGVLNVSSFDAVLLKNVYDKIDLRYYSVGRVMKYDYILQPFANYRQIKTLISGATNIKLHADGSVLLSTPFGQIEEAAPKVYQNNKELPARWRISGDTLSFQIMGSDPSQPMIIDPIVRDWATYYGGNDEDTPGCAKTDQSGNLYLSGYTTSSLSIATTGAHQTVFAGGINSTGDAYLVKFNNAGLRQWATYYGGDGTDNGTACSVDGSGNVYMTGYTNTGGWWSPASASLIAGPGSFISTYTTGTNGFLAKFNSSGVRQWGTYTYGYPYSCATDQNGDVYIAGVFPINFSGGTSAIIATPGCHQATYGGNQDGFIMKFTGSGSRLWGTYYGGNGAEAILSIAVDPNNNLYVAGCAGTSSGTLIASTGSHQFSYGGSQDAFLAKFNSSGTRLWSTYYGAYDYDYGWACCTDLSGNVYLAGTQMNYSPPAYSGTIIATPGSFQSAAGNGISDAFLVKFNSLGMRQWATYYGGSALDEGLSCSSDSYGNVYLSGITSSTNAIASASAYQGNFAGGTNDAYLAKFDNNGNRQWGTYYGDLGLDYGSTCISDIYNNAYLCGRTTSTANIASGNSHQSQFGGITDTYLAKFSECYIPATPVNLTPVSNASLCAGNTATLTAQSNGNITWYASLTGTTVAGLGASFTIPMLAAGIYTYYAGASLCGDSINPIRLAVTITVNTNPPPLITSNTGTICGGQTFTIQPSGAVSYSIYGGSFVVTPLYTTSYLISGTSSLGCVASVYATVNVSPSPTITVNSGNRCTADVYTITPSGAFTYSITGNSFTVTPNVNTSYSVTGTGSTGCAASNTAVVNVNIIPSPTVTITPSGSICAGDLFFINASSGPVTGWGGWSITGGNYIVSPSVTTSYTVSGFALNGCAVSTVVTVSVYPVPTVSVTSGFTCLADSYTISPVGATNYSISGNTFVVSPFQNTNYTVTGTNQFGCVSLPAVCTVSVLVRPTISTTSGTICAGQTITIAPMGGASYTISGGSSIVNPINTTTYSVIGTNTAAAVGCQVSFPVISTVFVNQSPTVTANNGTICSGQNFSIMPTGASTYTYSSGSAIVNPISNSTYSITGTNSLGCVSPSAALSQIVVLPKPTLVVVLSNTSICVGEVAILTASGAITYTLYGYLFNPSIAITPTITTQYTVIGSGLNGCIGSQQVTLSVELCTGISENINKNQSLLIYPNPSSGEFFIETVAEIEIELLDGLGQLLKRVRLSSGTNVVDLFEFAPGVYFIRPEGHYIGTTTKVIKL